jgi:hypothetical protein
MYEKTSEFVNVDASRSLEVKAKVGALVPIGHGTLSVIPSPTSWKIDA